MALCLLLNSCLGSSIRQSCVRSAQCSMAAANLPLPAFIQPERIQYLNSLRLDGSGNTPVKSAPAAMSAAQPANTPEGQPSGQSLLYWMQSSVRTEYNHALELAITWANRLGLPLVALFVINEKYPGATARSFAFLLEGLSEVSGGLERRGVRLLVRRSPSMPETVLDTCSRVNARMLVTDRGYTRNLREWRQVVAAQARIPVVQVESNVVVPVERASKAQEQSAASLRRKITPLLDTFLQPVPEVPLQHPSLPIDLPSFPDLFDVRDPQAALASLEVDRSVRPISWRKGGTIQAKALLASFMRDRLKGYRWGRKEMCKRHCSYLSAYIHFGHISTVYVALKVRQHKSSDAIDRKKFVDEMIVNRELAVNYVYYNPHYDSFDGLPEWAKATLVEHMKDRRPAILTQQQLQDAQTPDPYWNAAQNEAVYDGYMHNYMRMYWAKQVLLWVADPREAYRIIMELNDTFFIDGRDPNGYLGVAWCFGATDRRMVERPVFGKVRLMTPNGLRSKHDVNAYALQVDGMMKRARAAWGMPAEGGSSTLAVAAGSAATASSIRPSQVNDIRLFFAKGKPRSAAMATEAAAAAATGTTGELREGVKSSRSSDEITRGSEHERSAGQDSDGDLSDSEGADEGEEGEEDPTQSHKKQRRC